MTEFEEIYREYFDQVYLYIRRLSGDAHLAEDITGETFYKALRSLHRFRGDCDIRIWLCQIAKNCYYTHLKKLRRVDSVDSADLLAVPDRSESPEERLARQDETIRLQKILHDVPDPYKGVFLWRVYAELNYKQIGQLFGKSENWACVTYHRARNMIRKRWEEKE